MSQGPDNVTGSWSKRSGVWLVAFTTVVALSATAYWVDLSPEVEPDFFFSEGDPQLEASREIARRFPSPPQLVVRVPGEDIESSEYRRLIGDLSGELGGVRGIKAVHSIATDAPERSPLWSSLLLTEDGAATNVILQTDSTDPAVLVPRLEAVFETFRDRGAELQVSGVPYVIELIRRNLFRDLVVFSSAALVVFGIIVTVVYREVWIMAGTLTCCLLASAVTLLLAQALGLGIGLLTANIATIVFVLTLSHLIFLSANWRRVSGETKRPERTAVRMTLTPSFWCMLTTLLGFLSLTLASAKPLRELGFAGALGTVTALVVAYLAFPYFLSRAAPRLRGTARTDLAGWLPDGPAPVWLGAIAVAVVVAGWGLTRLSTDPKLTSYFDPGGEIHRGLLAVDRDGGSSSLNLVVRDTARSRIDDRATLQRLQRLHEDLVDDPAVGGAVSPVLLIGHARNQPLAGFLPLGRLLSLLDSPILDRVGRSFYSEDRTESLFFLRMYEEALDQDRYQVIDRLAEKVGARGFEVTLTGGQFELQAELGRLIASSLKLGLSALVVLFLGVAWFVARSWRVSLVMVACLAGIPLLVLGTLGWWGITVGIVSSPAANVALAMGVDSMIHLVTRARAKARERGLALDTRGTMMGDLTGAWARAREEMALPVLGATGIICAGFGIFSLSNFPPTQRFGLAVVIGTVSAALMTLVTLPLGASAVARAGEAGPEESGSGRSQ